MLEQSIPVLSFFTGAGFLDMGFHQTGFPVIWRNEFYKPFVRGYQHGWEAMTGTSAYSLINTHSIIDLGIRDILHEAFPDTPRPCTFGMIGGPPCPDFSVGGSGLGSEGERGKLSQVYVHRILELQPAFFLFENVPGLLRTTRHRQFLSGLKAQLSPDYALSLTTLNALEFGAPQDRERVFLIGFRRAWLRKVHGIRIKTNDESWFPWPEPRYPGAKALSGWPTTSPFGGKPPRPHNIPDELMAGTYICDQQALAALPNQEEFLAPRSSKLDQIPEGDVAGKSFKRLHRWRYSPAVAYGNNEVHLHPALPRRLSVREAFRIQTVPDTFALPRRMPLTDKFKTIGNGVPVVLAKAVAQSILRVLGGQIHHGDV